VAYGLIDIMLGKGTCEIQNAGGHALGRLIADCGVLKAVEQYRNSEFSA